MKRILFSIIILSALASCGLLYRPGLNDLADSGRWPDLTNSGPVGVYISADHNFSLPSAQVPFLVPSISYRVNGGSEQTAPLADGVYQVSFPISQPGTYEVEYSAQNAGMSWRTNFTGIVPIYISPYGVDTNTAGLYKARPLATLANATNLFRRDGQAFEILLAAGLYSNTNTIIISNISGITISGGWSTDYSTRPGNTVMMFTDFERGIKIINCQNFNLHSFTLNSLKDNQTNPAGSAIEILGCSGFSADNILVTNCKGNTPVSLSNCQNFDLKLSIIGTYDNPNNGGGVRTVACSKAAMLLSLISNGSGISSPEFGGGLYAENCRDLTINGFITLNNAQNGGGIALLNSRSITLNTSLISNRSVIAGGGLYMNSSESYQINGLFIANSAVNSGGALYSVNGYSNSYTLSALTNISDSGGGALYICRDSDSMFSLYLSNNQADSGGGGLYLYNSTNAKGIIHASYNISFSEGGGVSLEDNTNCDLNLQLSMNRSPSMAGGVRILTDHHGTYRGDIYSNWCGANSAGLWAEDCHSTVFSLNLISNTVNNPGAGSAGGAKLENMTNCQLNLTAVKNRSDSYGGGIYALNLINCILDLKLYSNTASANGGGASFSNCQFLTGNIIAIANSAANGGGLEFYGSSYSTIHGLFVSNSSVSAGGGISGHFMTNNSFYITNTGNLSSHGGGFWMIKSHLQTVSGLLAENRATNGNGGGISSQSGSIINVFGQILSNSANNSGGGGYFYDIYTLNISASTDYNSSKSSAGGGYYTESCSNTQICGTIISNEGYPGYFESTSALLRYLLVTNNSPYNFVINGGSDIFPDTGYIGPPLN